MKRVQDIMTLRRTICQELEAVHSSNTLKSNNRKLKKRGIKTMSRKEKRRFAKQMHKARRIAHSTKRPLSDLYSKVKRARGKKVNFGEILRPKQSAEVPDDTFIRQKPCSSSFEDERDDDLCDDSEEKNRLTRKARQLRDMIEDDEKEIKKYAKKLKLHKRKNNSLPKSFEEDGLAYVLDFCNNAERKMSIEDAVNEEDENKNLSGNINDNEEDDAPEELPVFSKRARRKAATEPKEESMVKKRVRFELKEDKEAKLMDDSEHETDKFKVSDAEDETEEGALTEDIYGRLRDKRGNIVKPTHELRNSDYLAKDNDKTTQILTKNFRSLINRLSEANVQMSVNKVVELYEKHGRISIKSCLTTALFNSLIRPEKVPDRLALEHCLLLAVLHKRLSTEITAYFVEELATKLKLFETDLSIETMNEMNKTTDNVCLVFSYLFLFKVIQAKLLNDILKLLSAHLNEKTVELILVILQSVGFNLRKEAPIELKVLIEDINVKASGIEINRSTDQSRMRFMLDTLQSVKNNNFLKVAHCDPELNDHFLKLLRGFFPGKQLESPLPMALRDLWAAPVNGRWWIVGSAVTMNRSAAPQTDNVDKSLNVESVASLGSSLTDFSDKLLRLAKKNHMNTDLRRNIFCIIVSSEDYLDAFEKLCRLSLKGQQEREIVHIAVSCCLKEKTYNPYYLYLVQRFCQHQPRFELTTQFAIWDKIKLVTGLPAFSIRNLGIFVGYLLANKVLPLSILKVIDFGAMDKCTETFCSFLFEKLLCEANEDSLKSMFADCLADRQKQKYEALVDGIKTFLNYFLLKDKRLITSEEHHRIVKSKIDALERFLYYHVGSSLL